jgi:hypothetical protein
MLYEAAGGGQLLESYAEQPHLANDLDRRTVPDLINSDDVNVAMNGQRRWTD